MYFVAGGNVVALKADTGTEVWKFPLSKATPGGAIRRGMTYWPGTPTHAPRVLVTMSGGKLVQLDAKTGTLVPDVGVDRSRERHHETAFRAARRTRSRRRSRSTRTWRSFPAAPASTTAGAFPAISRGFDLLTGKEVWRFHTVPHPGDPNFGTWGHERLAGPQGSGLVAAADGRQRERPRVRRARQRRRSELRQQPARAPTSTRRASSRSTPPPASIAGTFRPRITTSTTAISTRRRCSPRSIATASAFRRSCR